MTPDTAALPERFWSKVRFDRSGCWLWTAQINAKGYGQFRWNGVPRRAHRLVVEHVLGLDPTGLQVDHLCHVRSCVNPSHLQLATGQLNQENRVGANRNTTSGVRGVSWSSQAGKWYVRVIHQGRSYGGGFHADISAAERAAIALRNSVMTNNLVDRRSA